MKRSIPLLNIVLALSLLLAACVAPPEVVTVETEGGLEWEGELEPSLEVLAIDFSTDLDEQNEPIGDATSFPPGVERICGSFLPEGDISTRDLGWVAYEETPVDSPAFELLSASPSGRVGFCIYSGELPPGEHTVEVYDVDGNLLASGTFEIK